MAILESPGVSVTVTDESQYGTSGPGTIPLIVIATKTNKYQSGSTTQVASGTTQSNAGKLWLITSQRDALTQFGAPVFYSSGGTVEYDNELNEIGLFTLYEYLGIANQAYVLRADLDLAALIPSTTEPSGDPISGQSWLDLSKTTFGLFRSNGNSNPAFSWQSRVPSIISSSANLERISQGYSIDPVITNATTAISGLVAGTLLINGVSIAYTASDSLSTIASKINSNAAVSLNGIRAEIVSRIGKADYADSTTVGSIYNLRLVSSDISVGIELAVSGVGANILTKLGLDADPDANVILPSQTFGDVNDLAVNTLASVDGKFKNEIWEKINIVAGGSTVARWFKVGSTDATLAGWGWREASARVITGNIPSPVLNSGDSCKIKIGSDTELTVTLTGTSVTTFANDINTALDASNSGAGTNAYASVYTVGSKNYLRITNFDGTDIKINDIGNQADTAGHPFRDCGMPVTNTYWASVTGSVSNPSFTASQTRTQTVAVNNPGTGYEVDDTLTLTGGTSVSASTFKVTSARCVSVSISDGGTNYTAGDTLTWNAVSGGLGWTTPAIITVDSVLPGGIIDSISITNAGVYNSTSAVTNTADAQDVANPAAAGAEIVITLGVSTLSILNSGEYSAYVSPITNVATSSAGGGTGCTVNVTGELIGSEFTIDPGTGVPVTIEIPVSPGNTITGVKNAINASSIGIDNGGPIEASIVTSGSDNYLKIVNNNNTAFSLEDLSGLPLEDAGISAGITFGRKLVYQGWAPSLTPPSTVSDIASDNIWINTTATNQGANYVVKTYNGSTWQQLNTRPSTGTLPMYDSNSAADAGFGGLKQLGSTYVRYNTDGITPAEATQEVYQWQILGSGSAAWIPLEYTPSASVPRGTPADGTLWYNTNLRVDIMVNNGTQWLGYRNYYPATDPNGPLLSSIAPITQSTGAPLVDYDLWVDTAVTPYPQIYRYNAITQRWVLIDNTDQTTSQGIVFADARANATGTPTGSVVPSVMVLSDDGLDPDAPNALLYPAGMLLFNTRYSTNNVKVYRPDYFPELDWTARWVTASGNRTDGSPYMGSAAQRKVIINGLQGALAASDEARAEENFFNLIAVPGYPECIDEMIALNTDKKEVAFIVGDTPNTLPSTATDLQNWATNANNAAEMGVDGLTVSSPYVGLYYPWGLGTNLDGSSVVVPPSMMALRTIAFNDQVAYPWFAPAGYNRGLVTGVTSVGYVNNEGDYIPVSLNQGQRDILYRNKINPIANIPNRGLVVYGQKTLSPVSSALDRINVARLINYLKYQFDQLANPFLFEPNDSQTRQNVTQSFISFMNTMISTRAVYDFAVVCDTSNNTPDRIDRNELWIDVAIKPEKAIEFVYIPIRILNTGDPLPSGVAA